ncbi:MAG: peptidylprolyl isomerase [Candidatus Moraniibacteriota bacterium]
MKKADKDKNEVVKKVSLLTLISTLLIVAGVLVLFFTGFIYRFNTPNKIPDYLYNRVGLPAVVIDKVNFLSIGEINRNLSSIRRFYETQDFSATGARFDFSTEDGKRRLKIRERALINKMIEDRAIEILAQQRGIKISTKAVKDNVDRKMHEYGNQDLIESNLAKLYNWTITDFEDKVVRPSLYKDELEKWVGENDGASQNNQAKGDASVANERLVSGEDFDKLAKEISEGGTAETGGKLGWFMAEQISSEIREKVIALNKGQVSDILESSLGYHIIKLTETKETDGVKLYEISQIYFPKMSFALWLDKKIKGMQISVWLSEYKWNRESGLVEFKDGSMVEFEKKSLDQAQKDAALLTF